MSLATGNIGVRLTVNGEEHRFDCDVRTTLLDALRERLGLTGSKKGCDRGQCGSCTVLAGGRRIAGCLTLAVAAQDVDITTVEGLADVDAVHPVQASFLDHDAFQCGYCTPGQICSAVAVLDEIADGWPSAVTDDLDAPVVTDAEIRERMSGNICRCGAYANIVAAVRENVGTASGTVR